jgi:hypothetical protein
VGYINTATRYIDTSILFDLWQASLPEIFFSKPIRRLKPIERPAEEARYNISFIDPPLRGFGDISLSDDIFLGAKPLGEYHHFGKYYAESPSLQVYK